MSKISDEMTSTSTLIKECKRLGIPLIQIDYDENINLNENGGYIINLGGGDLHGTHWTCIIKNGAEHYYFDSFGLPAPHSIETQISAYYFNPYVIQDINEGFCGSYCVEFLQAMISLANNKKPSLTKYKTFLNQFHIDPKQNKHLLRELEKY